MTRAIGLLLSQIFFETVDYILSSCSGRMKTSGRRAIGFIMQSLDILLLIGGDLLPAHHSMDQEIGNGNETYAQRLSLGWVIVGETCLALVHQADVLNVCKNHILLHGRNLLFEPCHNSLDIKDEIIRKTEESDMPGLSREDRTLLKVMDGEMSRSLSGKWIVPLSFRENRPILPNNFEQAKNRAQKLAVYTGILSSVNTS